MLPHRLFSAGRDAEYDLAVEQYNQALLDGLREVVDQLASLRAVEAQRTEVVASKIGVRLRFPAAEVECRFRPQADLQ